MMLPQLAISFAITFGPMPASTAAHQPQLAVNGSTVALVFGAGNSIYFSSSSDSGRNFSIPVKVTDARILPLTRHRGPRIALAGDTIVITAVTGKTMAEGAHAHGLPSDGDLMAWRSTDGGRSWSTGVRVNDAPGAATEGLHALAAGANGGLFAAWLDKRSGQGTRLFGARSTDAGLTWSKNVAIYESPDGTICQCCHPSVAVDSGGQILVMWRNCLAGARDMYLVRSRDGASFSRPEKLGTGTWQLNACPMDGGGLAAVGTKIVTAWRREHSIYLASPGEKEVAIEDGTDVAVAASPAGTFAVWSTPAGIRVLIPGKKEAIAAGGKGSFPTVVALPDGRALAAWDDDGKIVVRRVPEEPGIAEK